MHISIHRAKALVAKFRRQKILVVGDLMLDKYIYGSVQRLSPEAPVPIVLVNNEKNMAGGAANVARNVKALGAQVITCGTVGDDHNGRQLLRVMRKNNIGNHYVLPVKQTKTTVKMRIIGERQQVVRVDWDDKMCPTHPYIEKLSRLAALATAKSTGVILADYAKGVVCREIVSAVLAAARRHAIPVALDPKENGDLPVEGIALITPNRREAFFLAGTTETEPLQNPLKDLNLLRVGKILQARWKPDVLVITLGAQGMLIFSGEHDPIHVATAAREVFDVSGAGDTAIASMMLALLAGASNYEAAELANCASGIVVGKIGTATCSAEELLQFIRNLHSS
jgi:D-beta-D-heptose 7-phosphate kinase/D-beta-D-heptose 1-phosphate adenosyltransferase